MLTENQKKTRSKGVGSSDIAKLVIDEEGQPLSPFGGIHTLWRDKLDLELPENKPGGEVIERGTRYEPVTAQWWADDTGHTIKKPDTIIHPKYPYCVDSCDYIASKDGKPVACVEIKVIVASSYYKWGEPGTDEVPLEHVVQCQWHMGHHELPICHLVVDTGYGRADYLIRRDDELFTCLVLLAENFWQDFVETGVEPPADGSQETGRWLSRHFKDDSGLKKMRPADEDEVDLMRQVAEAASASNLAEAKLKTLENQLKQAIGDCEGLFVDGLPLKATYRPVKGSKKLDVDGLLAEVTEGDVARTDALKEKYTKRGASYRKLDKRTLVAKPKGAQK